MNGTIQGYFLRFLFASNIIVTDMWTNLYFGISDIMEVLRRYAYSFDGLLVLSLLLICTCAYIKRVPKLKTWLLSEKKGFMGIFYKGAVIGSRLHLPVAISCVLTAIYVLILR